MYGRHVSNKIRDIPSAISGKIAEKFKRRNNVFPRCLRLVWPIIWKIYLFKKVCTCNVYLCIFSLQIIFNRLKMNVKHIRFAAATL